MNILEFLVLTGAILTGQQLLSQPVYQVDEGFSTEMLFRSCHGSVWYFYEREDGEIIVGGGFENTNAAWATPNAIGNALISPNGERNVSDWDAPNYKSRFMTEYDEEHLLITSQHRPALMRKDGNEILSNYFYPYSLIGIVESLPWSNRWVGDCHVFDDQSVICAGSLATDSTNQSRWRHLFRFNPDGMLDTDFPVIEGEPNMLTMTRGVSVRRLSDGSFILSGSFSEVNGHHSPHLIKLTADFDIDTTFVSPFGYHSGWGHQELLLLDSEDNLWVGGLNIRMPSGELSPFNLFKVSSSGEIDPDFSPGAIEGIPYEQGAYWTYRDPKIMTITELNEQNRFVIAGVFYKYNGIHARSITVVDANGQLQEGYFQNKGAIEYYCSVNQNNAPSIPAVAVVHELDDGSLLVGGGFSEFNTFDHNNTDEVVEEHLHYSVVKLNKNTLSTEDDDYRYEPASVYPNPAIHELNLSYKGNPDTAEILAVDGRILRSFRAGHSDMTIFDVSDLPPGMYLLRLVEHARSSSEIVRFVKVY